MEERIQCAIELYKAGYNCSQAVYAAFADLYGYTRVQALKMSASFGGGIGRMRMTCGAACGMFILAGLESGCTQAGDPKGKEENYRVVKYLASQFIARNSSLICSEIVASRKHPCTKTVEEAARIWAGYLTKTADE